MFCCLSLNLHVPEMDWDWEPEMHSAECTLVHFERRFNLEKGKSSIKTLNIK